MRPLISALLVPLILVAACAAEPGGTAASAWTGKSRADLVRAWGDPTIAAAAGEGGEILIYERQQTIRMQESPPLSGSDYEQSGSYLPPAKKKILVCRYEFHIDRNGIIREAAARPGYACLE